jgi:hypothetical protein
MQRPFDLEAVHHFLVLDLEDVTLVEATHWGFGRVVKPPGTQLENCPAYIREWIERETYRKSYGK